MRHWAMVDRPGEMLSIGIVIGCSARDLIFPFSENWPATYTNITPKFKQSIFAKIRGKPRIFDHVLQICYFFCNLLATLKTTKNDNLQATYV